MLGGIFPGALLSNSSGITPAQATSIGNGGGAGPVLVLSSGTNYTAPTNGSENGFTYAFIGTTPLSGSVTLPVGLVVGYTCTVTTFSTSVGGTVQSGGVTLKLSGAETAQNPSSPVANGQNMAIGSISSSVMARKISATQWAQPAINGIYNGTT